MCIYIYIHIFKKNKYLYIYIYIYVDVYTFLHQLPVGSLCVAVDEEVNELLPSRSKIFPTIPCHEQ